VSLADDARLAGRAPLLDLLKAIAGASRSLPLAGAFAALIAAAGLLQGSRVLPLTWSSSLAAHGAASRPPRSGPLQAAGGAPADEYGGYLPRVAAATGWFGVHKHGNRWMFVSPKGNGFWMTAVYGVIWSDSKDDLGSTGVSRVSARYGGEPDWKERWRRTSVRRLKTWGFNTLAEYHHWGLRPGPLPDNNPERMPFIHIARPAYYGLDNRHGYGTGPFKDLINGTDPRYYTGWRGAQTPDFFDPSFEAYANGWIKNEDGLKHGAIGNPWMLGLSMDDTDNLFGFGPGPDLPAARQHPHLGWIALVTNFEQAGSPWLAAYPDRRVYTKYALRDFLAAKYSSLAALNAAWRSSYTTFDSAGGWGTGSGLLDENGRHAWVGNERDEMAGATRALKSDLDEFLYHHARRYFTVMAAAMRRHAPRHLVFGPAFLNGWGGLTRPPILKAAGESVDVVQCAIGSPTALALTARYVGDKPLVTWDAAAANPDSALWRYPNPVERPQWPPTAQTQEDRGALYERKVEFLLEAVSADGTHPVAGIKFWSWGDHWGEKVNFGLVSPSENAYDGWEAVRARRTDALGFPTGGEERDYGDFLSSVSAAHLRVKEELTRTARPGTATPAPPSPRAPRPPVP
jgi:hypothetical protein